MNRLDYPSREAAQRYRREIHDALESMRKSSVLDMSARAWPDGLNRVILGGLPLRVRTRNCLQNEKLMEGDNAITVYELLRIPNFGRKSLADLLFAVDDFLEKCIEHPCPDHQQDGAYGNETINTSQMQSPETRTTIDTTWERYGKTLTPLLVAMAELEGAECLAELLSPECMKMAEVIGISNEIEQIRIDQLSENMPGPVAALLLRLRFQIEQLSPREIEIVRHRVVREPPKTLEALAEIFEVTRERIRQIQNNAERKIRMAFGKEIWRDMEIIVSVLKKRLGHVAKESEVESQFEQLLPPDRGFASKVFRKVLLDEMNFTLNNGVYLDEQAEKELGAIQARARKMADDVGLVNKQEFIECLPRKEWERFWPWLRESCEFFDFLGSLGTRDSGKARAKAALISIGCPATSEEVARICGFSVNSTRSHLSVIPSVVKADKDRWGLREWVDDEYDGIIGEIIQRIEEDGGATTTERLLRELPGKFGVSPMSVRAYMQTAKFAMRDGWISLASKSSLRLRDLDDVIDGRDDTGAPYWTFIVDARYFDGYSVPSVPAEFAKALGCMPDGSAQVRLENLPDCRDLSINWRLASINGASLGYVGEPLRCLGLEPGERVRITIKGSCLIQMTADDGSRQDLRDGEAHGILERIMQRRKVL